MFGPNLCIEAAITTFTHKNIIDTTSVIWNVKLLTDVLQATLTASITGVTVWFGTGVVLSICVLQRQNKFKNIEFMFTHKFLGSGELEKASQTVSEECIFRW